jgi:flagellar motor switch protein FliN/FliY
MSSLHALPRLDATREALQAFLQTLLGKPLNLELGEPSPVEVGQLPSLAQQHVLIWAIPAPFAVALQPDWVPLLAQAMLNESLQAGEAGSADLLGEVAAQGYGALRNALASEGVRLPEVSFSVNFPASEASFPTQLPNTFIRLPFTLQIGDAHYSGFLLLPPSVAEGKSASASEATARPSDTPVEVRPASFRELGPERIGNGGFKGNFELLADVELEVVVELGRRRLPLADVLRLTTGSIIELEKLVGEPLEIYANGRLIAEGEAVVIDEQFGVRITNLVTGHRQREKTLL